MPQRQAATIHLADPVSQEQLIQPATIRWHHVAHDHQIRTSYSEDPFGHFHLVFPS